MHSSFTIPKNLRKCLSAVLDNSYSESDLNDLVSICYSLSLPFIRRKLANGKLKLHLLGMSERDVVFDCIADLFDRDESGRIHRIQSFITQQLGQIDRHSDELLLESMRCVVFQRMNANLMRLYREADPVLGKIIHNLDAAVTRTGVFEKFNRLGDMYLRPRNIDSLLHLPPPPYEYLQQQFSRIIFVHEAIPSMLDKIHAMLVKQKEYQRTLHFMSVALLLKEIYALSSDAELPSPHPTENGLERTEMLKIIDRTCNSLRNDLYHSYVGKEKIGEDVFHRYVETVRSVLRDSVVEEKAVGTSNYEYFREFFPRTTRESYRNEHRTIMEYLIKTAKKTVEKELNGSVSAKRPL